MARRPPTADHNRSAAFVPTIGHNRRAIAK
jgi:hypothetical protein